MMYRHIYINTPSESKPIFRKFIRNRINTKLIKFKKPITAFITKQRAGLKINRCRDPTKMIRSCLTKPGIRCK